MTNALHTIPRPVLTWGVVLALAGFWAIVFNVV